MSIAASELVWHGSHAKGNARLVLLAIADHANEQGVAWPGVTRLMKMTKLCRRTVQGQLLILTKELAELRTERTGRSNNYYIDMQKLRISRDGQTLHNREAESEPADSSKLANQKRTRLRPNRQVNIKQPSSKAENDLGWGTKR